MKSFDFCLCLIIIYCATSNAWFGKKKELSPVIFVPGDGGSQLEARLHKNSSPYLCEKNADWYSLWLNLQLLIVPAIYCTVDNMRLHYDNLTRTTHNTQGVDIRVPGNSGI